MDSNKNENSVSKVSAIKKEINWISLTKFDLTRQKSKNYIKHIGIEKTNYATSGKIQKDSKTFQKILKDSKRFQKDWKRFQNNYKRFPWPKSSKLLAADAQKANVSKVKIKE